MTSSPLQIPQLNVAAAQLPLAYTQARSALSMCVGIDECLCWADKAAALASYARQANDEELLTLAHRIRGRAVRRAGELLKQIEPGQGARGSKRADGADTPLTRTEAARDAGMSERQQVTAIRLANIPAPDFERQIESPKPPTVTALAEQGKKPAPKPIVDLQGRDPGEFNRSLHFVAMFEDYAEELDEKDLHLLLPGLVAEERDRLRAAIASIDATHDRILSRI